MPTVPLLEDSSSVARAAEVAVIKIIIRGSSESSESSCARVNDGEGANLFAFTLTSAIAAVQFVNSIEKK